jgi:hypothetical protein
MPTVSQRTGANPYFQYSWKSSTAFSVVRPALSGKRGQGQVVSYSLSPSFAWTATPRVVKFGFKKSGKEDAIFWSIT